MSIKFGSLQLCKCLEHLGFIPEKQHGTSHQKWRVAHNRKIPIGTRPFITVVLGRKEYFPPTVSGYLRQLKQLGFNIEEIRLNSTNVLVFLDNLLLVIGSSFNYPLNSSGKKKKETKMFSL